MGEVNRLKMELHSAEDEGGTIFAYRLKAELIIRRAIELVHVLRVRKAKRDHANKMKLHPDADLESLFYETVLELADEVWLLDLPLAEAERLKKAMSSTEEQRGMARPLLLKLEKIVVEKHLAHGRARIERLERLLMELAMRTALEQRPTGEENKDETELKEGEESEEIEEEEENAHESSPEGSVPELRTYLSKLATKLRVTADSSRDTFFE